MTGCVLVDLSRADDDRTDRQRLAVLERCPDGARVVVDIGRRRLVSQDVAGWIHQHAGRLLVEIVGADPAAVATFVRAARAGHWSVV